MRYFKRNKIFTIILIVISVFIYTNYTRIIEPNPKINRKSSLYVNDIYMSDGGIYNNYYLMQNMPSRDFFRLTYK